jgi:hypothetical protein
MRRGISHPGVAIRVVVPVLLSSWTAAAAAQPSSAEPTVAEQVAALWAELERLQAEHRDRLAALEARLAALEGQAPTPTPAAAPVPLATAEVPAGAAGAGGPSGPLPVYGTPTSKVFNPDIAVIGNFIGTAGHNDFDPRPSLELEEAEVSFQAVVDPYARADFFLAFGPEGVEIEEGFLTFPTLPGGLLAKVGRLKASFGKVNTFHAHNMPWPDRPLVNVSLLGEEGLADSGLSLSRLLPVPGLFLEATGEVFRGESEGLFAAPRRRDLTWLGRLRAYRDLTESSNLELGGSFVRGHNGIAVDTTSRVVGLDATFRWRPLRRAIYRRFLARTELMWSRRGLEDAAAAAFGFYVSGEYQLARRWFLGGRFDQSERPEDPSLRDRGGSLLLTWWPSEFSQVRAQVRRTRYGEGVTANEALFQFLFSIGAHGAHPF